MGNSVTQVALHGLCGEYQRRGLATQGDSNVVGMPLSMLLRNAGVAALTSCHRISYKEVLMDSRADSRAAGRAEADACGPALPGAWCLPSCTATGGACIVHFVMCSPDRTVGLPFSQLRFL